MTKLVLTLFILSTCYQAVKDKKEEGVQPSNSSPQFEMINTSSQEMIQSPKANKTNFFGELDESDNESNLSLDSGHLAMYLHEDKDFVDEKTFDQEQLEELCNKPVFFYFKNKKQSSQSNQSIYDILNTMNVHALRASLYDRVNDQNHYTSEGLYRISDAEIDVEMTLKTFPLTSLKYFAREYNFLKRMEINNLNAPEAVLRFQGCLFDDKMIYMLLEPRKTLIPLSDRTVLQKVRKLPAVNRKEFYSRIANLLRMVHKKNFYHGAFSPDNIFVNENLTELRLGNFKASKDLAKEDLDLTEEDHSYLRYVEPVKENMQYNDLINFVQVVLFIEMYNGETTPVEIQNRQIFLSSLYSFEKSMFIKNLGQLIDTNCVSTVNGKSLGEEHINPEEMNSISLDGLQVENKVELKCDSLMSLLLSIISAEKDSMNIDSIIQHIDELKTSFEGEWSLEQANNITFNTRVNEPTKQLEQNIALLMGKELENKVMSLNLLNQMSKGSELEKSLYHHSSENNQITQINEDDLLLI